jgi:hypothetical protein
MLAAVLPAMRGGGASRTLAGAAVQALQACQPLLPTLPVRGAGGHKQRTTGEKTCVPV